MKSGATESSFYYLSQYLNIPQEVHISRSSQELLSSSKKYKILWAHDNCDQPIHANLPEVVSQIDKIVCVSHWEREQYIKYNRAPAEKLIVIPNGVNEMFSPSGNPKSKTCIFFSAPHKGIIPLPKIWKQVLKQHPDATLKVFSSGDLYPQYQNLPEFSQAIEELQSLPNVLYSSCIDREDLLAHIQDAAFFIHPNVWEETFCVSLAEALCCGCYPITTDMGALSETSFGRGKYVPMSGKNTSRGWIPDDTFISNFSQEVINALHFFDTSREEYEQVSKEISRIAIETYDWKRIAKMWEEVLPQERKVIDAFMFFNEFDILKLRLLYLNDIVSHFIICESNQTHSGQSKPYYLDEIFHQIPEEIRNKIIRLKYEPNLNEFSFSEKENYTNDDWKRERLQREFISQNLSSFSSDDLFMISDVDEIPKKEIIQELLIEKDFTYAAECELFYYNFETYAHNQWRGTIFSTVHNAIEKGCDYFRSHRNDLPFIENAGWHFSYFGGIKQIQNKLSSYAHQEYNQSSYIQEEHIQQAIENKSDLFVNEKNFQKYEFHNFPQELRDIIGRVYGEVNVCFATIPPRFELLEQVIQSFYFQTIRPNKIIITVPKNYHRFSYEPKQIETLCEKYSNFVHLLYAENDYGPATKIYGALKSLELFPNSSVIVCDDDAIYDPKLVECYKKSLQVHSQSIWTPIQFRDILNISNHPIWNLQGCNTYLLPSNILSSLNSQNFESKYWEFIQKNTNIQSLEDVFLHDDYLISCLLYDIQIPIHSFYFADNLYQSLSLDHQIHHLPKCHTDELILISNIRKSYGEPNTILYCDFLSENDEKISEYIVKDHLNVNEYQNFIRQFPTPFKILIRAETMNSLLDRKTQDIQEFYDWQIKYSQMPEDHIDYLFRLKYWNNFHPKVIYDIGSNYLSWYRLASNVWRDAKIYCVDAFSAFDETYKKYDIEYAIELLSDNKEEVEFYENVTCPGLSTLYKVNEIYDRGNNFYNENLHKTIRFTKTLDTLVKEKNWKKPDLIKIDVQGAEVNILQGATETLQSCNHLILEVQTKEFSTGAPMLSEVEQYMKSIGFVLLQRIGYNGDQECDGDYHFVRKSALPTK